MKFLKIALLSSLLLSSMAFANIVERLTGNWDFNSLVQDYQAKGYQKPFKEMMIENASNPEYYPKITEGTNLNTGDYVWKVSYSPYNADGDIVLLNPHPTLEVLNQRALEIAKREVTPLTEIDKQELKELFGDENIKQWEYSASNEEKERIKPLLVKFTDQDMQKIIDIKQEMQINFGAFEKVVAPYAKERVYFALSRADCKYDGKFVANLQASITKNGRVSNSKIDGIDDRSIATCLSKSIRRQKFMIMNKDGIPMPYTFFVTLHLK